MSWFTPRAKWLPLILSGSVFLWDFAAFQWVVAHEPGITARVVLYFDLALLPGTLLFLPMPAMLFDCGLACMIGLPFGCSCENVCTHQDLKWAGLR
jgi:hypothetical protein